MALALRLPLILACVLAACLSGSVVLLVAFSEADNSLVAALEGKALAHARTVKDDVEIALHIGIPLEEIRGAGMHLEEGAQEDPDIRFTALTDTDLARVHYGGIGRRRLDPLLASPDLRRAVFEAGDFTARPMDAVEVGGFSMTALPLVAAGETVGYVVVAVQAKQVREALLEEFLHLLPALSGVVLLLIEFGQWIARASFEDPLARLAGLMSRFQRPGRIERSGRHDQSELGVALLRFNGIVHRLADRAERVLNLAGEVQRAVFDREVAEEAGHRAERMRTGLAAPALGEPLIRSDPRASDLQMSITLLLAAATIGLGPILAGALPSALVWPVLGLAGGLVLPYGLRSPGWGLVAAGLALACGALLLLRPSLIPVGSPIVTASLAFGFCAGASLAAGRIYVANVVTSPLRWLVARLALGCLSGGLIGWTVVLEHVEPMTSRFVLLLLAAAVLAVNYDDVVRQRMFRRARSESAP
jgi:hypothetical protein